MCLEPVWVAHEVSCLCPPRRARLPLWPFALEQPFSASLGGRNAHDYYGPSAPACSAHCPSPSPRGCGEEPAGSLVAFQPAIADTSRKGTWSKGVGHGVVYHKVGGPSAGRDDRLSLGVMIPGW
jgi:hypothetical protein